MGYSPSQRFWRVGAAHRGAVIIAGLGSRPYDGGRSVTITTFIGLGGLGLPHHQQRRAAVLPDLDLRRRPALRHLAVVADVGLRLAPAAPARRGRARGAPGTWRLFGEALSLG